MVCELLYRFPVVNGTGFLGYTRDYSIGVNSALSGELLNLCAAYCRGEIVIYLPLPGRLPIKSSGVTVALCVFKG